MKKRVAMMLALVGAGFVVWAEKTCALAKSLIKAVCVWTCNWIRINWQIGRHGRIKVVVAGLIILLITVVGMLVFARCDSSVGSNEIQSDVATACQVPKEAIAATDSDKQNGQLQKPVERSLRDNRSRHEVPTLKRVFSQLLQGSAVDRVKRDHDSFATSTAESGFDACFQLRCSLVDGGRNYIIWTDNGPVSMVVFNDADVFDASRAYKQAVRKARDWIAVGREHNTTLDHYKDMCIDVPNGSAVRIGEGIDQWIKFNTMANIPNHKKSQTRFEFKFTADERCLRLNCGGIYIDSRWTAGSDEEALACLESACDIDQLFLLERGRKGESSALNASQAYKAMPSVSHFGGEIPEWSVGDACFLHHKFANCDVTFSHDGQGGYNYAFSPWNIIEYPNRLNVERILIFPRNSYDEAYRAIEEAFLIALAWRDIAKSKGMLNLGKEILVSCPDSISVKVIGAKWFRKELWNAIENYYPPASGKTTRFWFYVYTEPTHDGKNYVYKPSKTKYFLYFGNADGYKCLELCDENIAVFGRLNPQQALKALRKQTKSEEIFR